MKPALNIAPWLSDSEDEVRAALDIAEEDFNLAHIRLLRARLFELEALEGDAARAEERELRRDYYQSVL